MIGQKSGGRTKERAMQNLFSQFLQFAFNTFKTNSKIQLKLINAVFYLVVLYISQVNLVITINLWINRGIFHELIIGWEGISLIPNLEVFPKKKNQFYFFDNASFPFLLAFMYIYSVIPLQVAGSQSRKK